MIGPGSDKNRNSDNSVCLSSVSAIWAKMPTKWKLLWVAHKTYKLQTPLQNNPEDIQTYIYFRYTINPHEKTCSLFICVPKFYQISNGIARHFCACDSLAWKAYWIVDLLPKLCVVDIWYLYLSATYLRCNVNFDRRLTHLCVDTLLFQRVLHEWFYLALVHWRL